MDEALVVGKRLPLLLTPLPLQRPKNPPMVGCRQGAVVEPQRAVPEGRVAVVVVSVVEVQQQMLPHPFPCLLPNRWWCHRRLNTSSLSTHLHRFPCKCPLCPSWSACRWATCLRPLNGRPGARIRIQMSTSSMMTLERTCLPVVDDPGLF